MTPVPVGQQLKSLIEAGKFDEARRLVKSNPSSKSESALARIDAEEVAARERATAAAAHDEMTEIKTAIREKRYDDADALLVLSDHPDAAKLRERLAQIRGEKPLASPPKIKASMPTGSKARRLIILMLFIGVVVAAGIIQSNNWWREYTAAMTQYAIYDICWDVYRDDYPDADFEPFHAGCNEEARHMIDSYSVTVERCYQTWKDEDHKLLECLADGGAKFAGIYLFNAVN